MTRATQYRRMRESAQSRRTRLEGGSGDFAVVDAPTRPRSPTRDLLRAVLIQALHDLCLPCNCAQLVKQREKTCQRCQAAMWIDAEERQVLVGIDMICDGIGVDVDWLRPRLRLVGYDTVREGVRWRPTKKLGAAA